MFTLKRIWKTSSFNARKPNTVLNGLNTPQSVSAVFLTALGVYFVMFNDSRNYAGFLVEKISPLGHPIKSIYSWRLKKFELRTFFTRISHPLQKQTDFRNHEHWIYPLFSYEAIVSNHKALRLFETPPGILITRTFRFFNMHKFRRKFVYRKTGIIFEIAW